MTLTHFQSYENDIDLYWAFQHSDYKLISVSDLKKKKF